MKKLILAGLLLLLILPLALLAIVPWVVAPDAAPEWSGFGQQEIPEAGTRTVYRGTTKEVIEFNLQPPKTLWDWLDLIIVGAVIAIGGILLNRSARNRELDIAEKNRSVDIQIARDRQNQQTLEHYLDRMSDLLLDERTPLRDSVAGNKYRIMARTRTLATLRALDGERKGSLLRFLHESELIDKGNPIVDLKQANLSRAELSSPDLSGANLSGTNLSRADLRGAKLSGANLTEADLSGADLSGADLSGADLELAKLSGAKLRWAYLDRADLRRAYYNSETIWPTGFDPEAAGAVLIESY